MGAHIAAGDGMGFARVELEIVGYLRFDEFLDVLDGVLHVDVVVAGAVDEEQAAVEFGGGVDDGEVLVAFGEVGGQAHVALGVDRVVVAPVGDGCDGDAGAEAVRVAEGVEGEGAAPTPTPPAEALGIKLRIAGKRGVDDGELIFKLHGSEVVVRGLGEVAAAHAGAAVVGMENGEAVLGEERIEEERGRPFVGDVHGAGAAVGIDDERNRGGIGDAFWQQQCGVERGAVVGFDFKLLGRVQVEGFERVWLPEAAAGRADGAKRVGVGRDARGVLVEEV